MFRDNSLIPTEAIRLAALGFLAEGKRRYGDLVAEIRHFTTAIAGPSLELMGTSLELLRYEGLVGAALDAGPAENAVLEITPAGRAALAALLKAQLRAPLGDYNRLAVLLKLRFLGLLPHDERQAQRALIAESLESELVRLNELRRAQSAAPGAFRDWIDQDIAALETRLAAMKTQVPAAAQ
jgi:DNA-binding PadR family transcriptional regulator